MAKDLTTSAIDRQNILNNPLALPKIQEALKIKPLEFKGRLVLTKQMVAEYYGVDERTIERCLKANEKEIWNNGYIVIKGNELKEFRLQYVGDIDVAHKAVNLGLFDFRSFINIGMLLTTSERAKELRSCILDIVIAVMNEKSGGSTKYVNRRDRNYIGSAFVEEDYHKKLTDVIKDDVEGRMTINYPLIMDMIYKAVFCEKADEYKKLLDLSERDNLRRTLYAEVLVAVSSFENATAEAIKAKADKQGTLSVSDVEELITELSMNPLAKPIVEDARIKMASRDNALRDVYHGNLAAYIRAVMPEEYQKFVGNLFEAMIDDLVGDKKENLPNGLKDQEDGKRVDHIYEDIGLTNTNDKSIYYIGDSKYYKLGNDITAESVYKQYTYARNVIQWNMNLFLDNCKEETCYRNKLTEGYNIVPNFFISARMDDSLSYSQDIYPTENEKKSFISRHFENRLFDRDTLLISHYDVNFLYIISLYAQDNDSTKKQWKQKVRKRFREEIQEMLNSRFVFYAMTAHLGVNAEEFIKANFQSVLGKLYQPYHRNEYFSLALDKDEKYKDENESLLNELRKSFYVEEVCIGADPESVLIDASKRGTSDIMKNHKNGVLMVMMEKYENKNAKFLPNGQIAIGIKYTKDSMEIVEHLAEIGYILFHTRKDVDQHLYKVINKVELLPEKDIPDNVYRNISTTKMYAVVKFEKAELDSSSLHPSRKTYTPETRYDAQYSKLSVL